jgi:xanthine/uracil/vitamin C permease (AzgA family)
MLQTNTYAPVSNTNLTVYTSRQACLIDCISHALGSVLVLSAVDRVIEPQSGLNQRQ